MVGAIMGGQYGIKAVDGYKEVEGLKLKLKAMTEAEIRRMKEWRRDRRAHETGMHNLEASRLHEDEVEGGQKLGTDPDLGAIRSKQAGRKLTDVNPSLRVGRS